MGQPLRIEPDLQNAVEDLLQAGYVKNGTRAYDIAEQVVHLGRGGDYGRSPRARRPSMA